MKNKKMKRAIIIVASVVALVLGLFIVYKTCFDPHRGIQEFVVSEDADKIMTKAEALEDIKFAMNKVRTRHPAWLEDGNERVELVEKAYEEAVQNLPDSMTVLELYTVLGGILSPLHDGHTYVYHNNPMWMILDDLSYLSRYGVPTKINGEPTDDVVQRFLAVDSYEVESDEIKQFYGNNICFESELRRSGVNTANGVDFTYIIDGEEVTVHHGFTEYDMDGGSSDDDGESDDKWVFYDIDKENNLGIFVLYDCTNNEEYRNTVKEFFTEVDKAGITNIAIDLRDNPGGSSAVATVFIRYLNVDEYNHWCSDVRYGCFLYKYRNVKAKNNRLDPQFDGNVYVLTNSNTYSSAMDFTMYIMDNDLGQVVGEPSSNLPDSYGDCLYFVLPNSRIDMSVSFKKWYRIDQSKAGELLMPDYPCDADYALEKVYELISK